MPILIPAFLVVSEAFSDTGIGMETILGSVLQQTVCVHVFLGLKSNNIMGV